MPIMKNTESLCAVCRHPVYPERLIECHRCETSHHADCWEYNGGCAVYGCRPRHSDQTATARPAPRLERTVANLALLGLAGMMLWVANQRPAFMDCGPLLSPRCTIAEEQRCEPTIIVIREQAPVTNVYLTMANDAIRRQDQADEDSEDSGVATASSVLEQTEPQSATAKLEEPQTTAAQPPVIGAPVNSPDGVWEAWSEGWPARDPRSQRVYPAWSLPGASEPGPAACHLCRVLVHKRGDNQPPRALLILGQDDPFQPWYATTRIVGWNPDGKHLLCEIVSGRRGDEETVTSLLELDLNGRPRDVLELDTFLAMEEQGLYYGEVETQNSAVLGYTNQGAILFETHRANPNGQDTLERWTVDAAKHLVSRVGEPAKAPATLVAAKATK
jgi:hypothetical protein